MNHGSILAAVFAVLFLIVTGAWITGVPHAAKEYSVIDEWNLGIRKLGITPVFPPREDIQVGDLHLSTTPVTARKSDLMAKGVSQFWLGDLGFAELVKDFYKKRFSMPVEIGGNDPKDKLAPLPSASKGVFTLQDVPTRLRSVSFPSFTVASNRSAKLSVGDSVLHFFNSFSYADSGYDVTVSLPDAESYGIPALTAIAAISRYCEPDFEKNIELLLSTLPKKAPATIEVVTEIFYARSIDYTVTVRIGAGGMIEVKPADLEKIRKQLVEIEQLTLGDRPAKNEGDAPGDGDKKGAAPSSTPSASSERARERASLEAIKAELEKMSKSFERPNAPAASGAVIRADSRSVTLRQTFAQPVVIGYRGLTFPQNEFPSRRPPCPPPPEPPQCLPAKPCVAPLPTPQQSFLMFFDWDTYNITSDGMAILQKATGHYKAGGSVQLQVTGYADLSGSAGYNQRLSERRANTVANALASMGVARDDVVVTGRGMNDPRVPTPLGVHEPQNRRVEITIR